MGVIKRQSIKTSILKFLGVFLGAVNVLYVYPLSDETYGFSQFLISSALLFTAFSGFGTIDFVSKFFPEFKKRNEEGLFFGFTLVLLIVGFIFFTGIIFLVKGNYKQTLDFFSLNENVLDQYFVLIYILVFLYLLTGFLIRTVSNYNRITIPTLLNTLGPKIYLPIAILLVYYNQYSLNFVAFCIIIYQFFVLGALVFYLIRLNASRISFRFKQLKRVRFKSYASFMLFGMLGSFGALFVFRVDSIMISMLLGFASNGIYTKILYISSLMDIVPAAISQIAQPTISKLWANHDLNEIKKIHKKSSEICLIVSGLIFLNIYFSLDEIISISSNPASFENGKNIFLTLGICKIIYLSGNNSSTIIGYSPSYMVGLLFVGVLSVCNVSLNYYFIKEYELIGAAIASGITIFISFSLTFLFLLFKYGINPFSLVSVKIVLFLFIGFIAGNMLEGSFDNPIIAIMVNGVVISSLVISGVYFLNLSEDINKFIDEIVRKILKKM